MPVRNGPVPEPPGGEHITQCGATPELAAGEPEAEDEPLLAAELDDLADPPDEDETPAVVVDVVVAVDDVADDAVAVIAGKLTAPEGPLARAVPAMVEAAAAVCAAAAPVSAISSKKPRARL